MASLDFAKYTSKSMGGLSVHFDQEKRERLNHSNEQINKELTQNNYMIGTSSYAESIARCRERTEQVDKEIPPKRVKQDRVVMDMCYIPCPNEIENRDDFFQKSYDFLVERFGSENVHGAFIHKDEVHEYRDSRVKDVDGHQTVRTSMEHMHVMISPYTEEKGINSKAFNTREMFQSIQQDFNKYIYQEFGVEYNTREQALGLKVEELKEATELLEQKEMERAALDVKLINVQAKVEEQQEMINNLELTIHKQEKELQALKQEVQDKVGEVKKINESHIEMPYKDIRNLPVKEMGNIFKKEMYVRYDDIADYKEQAEKAINKANDIIWQHSHNNFAYDHNAWKVKELEEKLSHYRKDDLVKDNERLTEENAKLKTNVDKYQGLYARECQEHQNTKEQLQSKENTLNWYKSIYTELIKFMDKLQINGNNLLHHFIKDKPQKTQEYIKQDIEEVHQSEREQRSKGYELEL